MEAYGGVEQNPDDPDVYAVTRLPPENMKVAQAMSEIDSYLFDEA